MADGEGAFDLSAQREAALLKILREVVTASRDDIASNQKALKDLWKRSTM
jgi:hypothetical protein